MLSLHVLWRLPIIILWVLAGCGTDADVSTPRAWQEAQRSFRRRDLHAYDQWIAIDPKSAEGQIARRRLRTAGKHYQDGVRRIQEDRADARAAFEAGRKVAPMDPVLYLVLGRAYRARGLARATEFYVKFLATRPYARQAPAARRELKRLDAELAGLFPTPPPRPSTPGNHLYLLGIGLVIAFGFAGWLTRRVRLRRVTLAYLVSRHPELHPAVAYLVGSLRHELIKHRVIAMADVLTALHRGDATPAQRDFLRRRFIEHIPLEVAFHLHCKSFERALGHGLDLAYDPDFRRAGRALAIFARAGTDGSHLKSMHHVLDAQEALRTFDDGLAKLVARLVRTRVDGALLDEAVKEVRSEYSAGQVVLDSIESGDVPPSIEVEVFRADLLLILRNVIRNAVLALERAPTKRVRLSVVLEVEPTGEEVVQIQVWDTSMKSLDPEALQARPVDRGLGLVGVALHRYNGSMFVEPGRNGWTKAVVVRFFRSLDAGTTE